MADLRAFMVTAEASEESGGVIFAKSHIEARRIGASEWNDGELGGMTVRRSPRLDRFSPGPVPAWVLVSMGWTWEECAGCALQVSEDSLEEAGLAVEGVRGNDGSLVFCCARCEGEWRDRRRAAEAAGQAVISAMIARLHRRFRGQVIVEKSHHYTLIREGLPTTQEASVEFSWPGQKIGNAVIHLVRDYYSHAATMLPPSLQIRCCMGDKEAFEKFAEEWRG